MENITEKQWEKCLSLLADPSISEIETNGPNLFFCKRNGSRESLPISFSSEKEYAESISNVLAPLIQTHSRFNPNGHIFEGPLRLKTSSGNMIRARVHIMLPPVSDVPQVTIAKKSTQLTSLAEIAKKGSMSLEMYDFLHKAIDARLTIAVSGAGGSGKTTLLEALTQLINEDYRIGVAEDTPELYLKQKNVTYLHSVPFAPGMNVNEEATLSWVVSQLNRMRVDSIIIGETRGKEFADFLVAANSGVEGSLTTIHANEPRGCLEKMANFALKGSERLPLRAINNDISKAIDLIIQLTVTHDGKHRISRIEEVTETLGTGDDAAITTSTLFQYHENGDYFTKASQPGEKLREKFEKKKIDTRELLSIQIDKPNKSFTTKEPVKTEKTEKRGISLPGGLQS